MATKKATKKEQKKAAELAAMLADHRRYNEMEKHLDELMYGTEDGLDANSVAICELEIALLSLKTRLEAE